MLNRVQMMSMIRLKLLARPDLHAVLQKKTPKIPRHSTGLPDDWTARHDIGLLQGVDRHGMAAWESMKSDAKLPFILAPGMRDEGVVLDVPRLELPREKVCECCCARDEHEHLHA